MDLVVLSILSLSLLGSMSAVMVIYAAINFQERKIRKGIVYIILFGLAAVGIYFILTTMCNAMDAMLISLFKGNRLFYFTTSKALSN